MESDLIKGGPWAIGSKVRRYAAYGWSEVGLHEIQSAEFVRKPKAWRIPSGCSCSAFGHMTIFADKEPPGFATEREAVLGWIQQQENQIAARLASIEKIRKNIEKARRHPALASPPPSQPSQPGQPSERGTG